MRWLDVAVDRMRPVVMHGRQMAGRDAAGLETGSTRSVAASESLPVAAAAAAGMTRTPVIKT